jgi:phosphohistidine phosphatase
MKTLIIVRHGKSSWDLPSINDMDRPLTERGIHDGYAMATSLIKPELIISSPAIRALHTAIIFTRALNLPAELLQINEVLYFGEPSGIIEYIRQEISNKIETVAIVGHNPIITMVANHLSKLQIEDMPTTGIATLTFGVSAWSEISRDTVSKESFNCPKKK